MYQVREECAIYLTPGFLEFMPFIGIHVSSAALQLDATNHSVNHWIHDAAGSKARQLHCRQQHRQRQSSESLTGATPSENHHKIRLASRNCGVLPGGKSDCTLFEHDACVLCQASQSGACITQWVLLGDQGILLMH